ncbi:MAG TPA: AAA family ATPase [Syntrophomonadaceae bacterium]|nr:AAA family ATPase [Syntrophomonadaceae bacterium]HPF44461.1 AAA family ATPase [Syntrophomonadaceae bacterium]
MDQELLSLAKEIMKNENEKTLAIKTDKESTKTSLPIYPAITNLADVEPEEVRFLWPPYIPFGKLTILEGDPGLGKTFLSLCVCAAISNGGVLPDQEGKPAIQLSKGRVLFMTAEDGLADTLVPRLEMMGADRSMISCLTGWRTADSEEEMAFSLADVNVLRAALDETRPDLVVIDPLQAYLGGGVDMHRANETRPLLSNLGKIAEEYSCAVLAIRHLSKGSSKALYRGLGSIDFTAAARSVLTVGQEPVTKQKAMAHIKSSCAMNGVTLSFDLHSEFGFVWSGVSSFTVEDLLAVPSAVKDEEMEKDNRLEEAAEFLYDVLEFGPVESKEIEKQAKAASIKWRTVQRAKEKLDFKAFRRGDRWFWPQLSRMSEIKNGIDGADDISSDALRLKGSAPSAPKEISGIFDDWSSIGTEINNREMTF